MSPEGTIVTGELIESTIESTITESVLAFQKIFQYVISVNHEDSNAKRIRELCPCSDEAMGKMKMAMTEYQIDQKTHPGKTTVDDLVKNIKKIAFGENRTLIHYL